ncbi:MAG: hypothetical protein U5S82_23420 [Gammaproteobacteria bacterium]|nr:hypothetical protein [Gammaproteobacteria bacterium]
MENEHEETRNTDPGPADKAFLRNLIIAKGVVIVVILVVVGLMVLLM